MTVSQNGSVILTRWYPGTHYMKEIDGTVVKEFTYIGGDAYTAPVIAVKFAKLTTYYYILRDYLGNVMQIINTSGAVTAEYSYDAWGRMRNPQTWVPYAPGSEPTLFTRCGFTGHEHLPWFNLVNMNGRLYDPLTARFLSPDQVIQDPGSTQNLNRYTYAFNNPLKFSDITGNISSQQYRGDFIYSRGTRYHYCMNADGSGGYYSSEDGSL
jgi:RHS repeat-associated protein